jgi:hypothetical protein
MKNKTTRIYLIGAIYKTGLGKTTPITASGRPTGVDFLI